MTDKRKGSAKHRFHVMRDMQKVYGMHDRVNDTFTTFGTRQQARDAVNEANRQMVAQQTPSASQQMS